VRESSLMDRVVVCAAVAMYVLTALERAADVVRRALESECVLLNWPDPSLMPLDPLRDILDELYISAYQWEQCVSSLRLVPAGVSIESARFRVRDLTTDESFPRVRIVSEWDHDTASGATASGRIMLVCELQTVPSASFEGELRGLCGLRRGPRANDEAPRTPIDVTDPESGSTSYCVTRSYRVWVSVCDRFGASDSVSIMTRLVPAQWSEAVLA
jgi:hypothetical protein